MKEIKRFFNLLILMVAVLGMTILNIADAESSGNKAEGLMTREQWYSQLRWNTSECPLDSPDTSSAGVIVHGLETGEYIIIVECERWAYQGTQLFYLRKGSANSQLEFEQFEPQDIGKLNKYLSPILTGLPQVRTTERIIEVLRKYRGMGDCGQFLRYRFESDSTILKELRIRKCDEKPGKFVSPHKWPLLKVKP